MDISHCRFNRDKPDKPSFYNNNVRMLFIFSWIEFSEKTA